LTEVCRQHLREKEGDFRVSNYNQYFGRIDRLEIHECFHVEIYMFPGVEFGSYQPGRFSFALKLGESMQFLASLSLLWLFGSGFFPSGLILKLTYEKRNGRVPSWR
jgi:hypothetical protein